VDFTAFNPSVTQGLDLLSGSFVKQIGFLIVSVPHDSDDSVSHLESLAVSSFTSRSRLKCKGDGIDIRADVERANHPPI